jgi:succinoglycan biosynthesis transport protein ExoP
MSLHQFLAILRARRRLAGTILLSVVLLALAWVLVRPANYVARAPVLVEMRTDPVGATPLQAMSSPSYLSTQIDIVKSHRVAERALELLPAEQEPMLRLRKQGSKESSPQEWLVNALQRQLEVKPARESNVISITWAGRSPAEAARVANAFAQAYFDTNLNLRTAPAKRDSEWFDQQVAQARDRVDKAQARLAEFQERTGIVSSTEQGDFERQQLADMSTQLQAAESSRRTAAGPASADADSPVVNTLRSELARLESKVDEASATMGSNHPKLRQLEAEANAMRSRLAAESSRASRVASESGAASANRIRELREQMNAQKARVLAMGKHRGELNVLQREAESAQKAYDIVAASAAQSRLQSVSNQGNVLFLGAATEPLEPSGLSPMQALVVALGGGLLLGIAGALLAELANRRVRSVEDLEAVTQLPILGVLPAPRSGISPLVLADPSRRLAFNPQRSLA